MFLFAARKIEKKIRGKSRGVRLDRLITSANGQLHIDFSSGKPKGPNVEMFSTEIGNVVRSHAPLNVEKWDDIPEEQTQPLIDRVLVNYLAHYNVYITHTLHIKKCS